MAEYKYDEEGGQFLTFVLTFLLLILVPLTYSLLAPSPTRTSKKGSWDARGQKIDLIKSARKRSLFNPQISSKAVFVLAGWAIVAYLFQTILNTASNSSHAVYDPFQILGIAASATEKEIKKHYKRLSVKFHPDKLVIQEGQTKEEVEGHYIELTKAYKALTDETIRKNFELYGHPDGKQEMSMGIALPRWVIESQNNVYVLGMYAIVLGLGLPYLVARWWYGSRSKTKDGIVNSTAQTYFQHLRDDTNASRIFALLAISDEFTDVKLDKLGSNHRDEAALAKLESEIRKILEEFGPEWHLIDSFKSASVRKALILLYAHTLRIDSGNKRVEEEKLRYAAKAVQLINGLMAISLAHNWLETTLLLMQFTQCMVQAVPLQDLSSGELLQLPHLTVGLIKKLQEANSLANLGIQGFWKIPDAERKAVLVKQGGLGVKEYDEMVRVTGMWPRLELVDAFFKVSGERLVTTGAIVQFVVKLRLLPPKKDGGLLRDGRRLDAKRMDEESSVRPDEEVSSPSSASSSSTSSAKLGEKEEGKEPIGFARAPYFWEERKPSWWVLIGDQKLDRVIVQPTKVTDIGTEQIRTYSVQFQAPPQAGLYTFQAILKSDSFLGSDASRMVKLKVEDASVLEEDDGEDEISEPEEDSLAGQMALMKGQKVKPSRREEHDEDEESDDESGTDDDVNQNNNIDDSDSDSDSDSD